ncbi:hypothetical protein CYMTET_42107 [Cymbomonas tetramitiformis]|uniref:Uncharacterized protein n=1 Tax=Cymbomonas tetramitiformis TaxID=36881 RepID=A0AAE0C5V6_9CHLO|nr:hypothetical protein CYMTET_42107 [Cymbomonas tetramitiformis]
MSPGNANGGVSPASYDAIKRCANRRQRPRAKLDTFNREGSIGFAAPFTVTIPEDTRIHLGERFASMWTDALAKVENSNKLEGAVPLTGGKMEVVHTSAGSGNSKVKTDFYDSVLGEEDRRHPGHFRGTREDTYPKKRERGLHF